MIDAYAVYEFKCENCRLQREETVLIEGIPDVGHLNERFPLRPRCTNCSHVQLAVIDAARITDVRAKENP